MDVSGNQANLRLCHRPGSAGQSCALLWTVGFALHCHLFLPPLYTRSPIPPFPATYACVSPHVPRRAALGAALCGAVCCSADGVTSPSMVQVNPGVRETKAAPLDSLQREKGTCITASFT